VPYKKQGVNNAIHARRSYFISDRGRFVLTKHINNVFKEGELDKERVCAKFAHTAADGKTYQVDYYNLDAYPLGG
jgi:hypothetical protein